MEQSRAERVRQQYFSVRRCGPRLVGPPTCWTYARPRFPHSSGLLQNVFIYVRRRMEQNQKVCFVLYSITRPPPPPIPSLESEGSGGCVSFGRVVPPAVDLGLLLTWFPLTNNVGIMLTRINKPLVD